MKTRLHWCDRTLVLCPVFYAVCTSEKQFSREMKRLNVKEPPPFLKSTHAHATGHHFEFEDRKTSIVCMGSTKGRKLVEIVGLLAHEATHLWQAIRDHIGEHSPSIEFEAYSVQCITQQLIESWAAQDKRGRVLMK